MFQTKIRTITLQLISPAAQTLGEVLQVNVSFSPVESPNPESVVEVLPPAAANALWQLVELWQTLHPVPVHPDSQEHPEEVRFPKDVADELWISER